MAASTRILILLAPLGASCTLEPAGLRETLDARGYFEALVKPQLVASCAACHATREPFLQPGREYESIIEYKGGLFLTRPPELSYLLHRGQHQGPPLTDEQAAEVLAWLRLQVRQDARPVAVTPTVSAAPGEYFLSLKQLVGDPLARITFRSEALPHSMGSLLLSDLKLVAGPEAGIQVKHPRFVISSAAGVVSDPADSLSNVELNLEPREARPLGPGGVILTNVPKIASLAVAFASIQRVQPQKMATCKALDLFGRTVRPTLAMPCATTCHGGPNSVATNAFNMRAATSTDAAEQMRFCLDALARTNPEYIEQSALLRQVTPPAQGGTPNHPYKLSDPGPFRQAVAAWVAAETK
ncbi:MAG: hypothetical protein RMK29_06305 [Myxococcales bacterium]|nr:hypothetical protein [Myxococcota bacterium]MDW8281304.1 hypothetical protein [Myxococcales bacterium]